MSNKSRLSFVNSLIQKYAKQQSMVDFEEEQSHGYKIRTIKNASADATIAFAVDFSTGGEVLTKTSVIEQGNKYIPIDVHDINSILQLEAAIHALNDCKAKTLNIAGNGLYTMKGRFTQQEVDKMTYGVLNHILCSPKLLTKIELIRSGGQSGFDEAGIKAAIKLNIPALILAPKGWLYRDVDGTDIRDEATFKNRFNTI
jgi:hypothetical protein